MEEKPMVEKSGENWRLAYRDKVRATVRENPGILKTVMQMIPEAEELPIGSSMEKGGIKITHFCRHLESEGFRVDFNGLSFFVKRERDRRTGIREMRAFEEAAKRIEGRSDVRLVDYQLGYVDSKGRDYFVSDWENLSTLQKYWPQHLSAEERAHIDDTLRYIRETLPDFIDKTFANMFYDPQKKQLVLFDLQRRREETGPIKPPAGK